MAPCLQPTTAPKVPRSKCCHIHNLATCTLCRSLLRKHLEPLLHHSLQVEPLLSPSLLVQNIRWSSLFNLNIPRRFSECVLTGRVLSTSPSLPGWLGGCWERGTGAGALAAAQVEAWLAGHAAAAGSGESSWLSQECSAPSLSQVICCRLCLTFARKNQAWNKVALHSPPSAGPAGQTGATQEEHLLLLSGPAAATLEDNLACFARRARGPSRCHSDRLPGLRFSAGLMAYQTPLPGLVCSTAPLAESSPKHRHSSTQSFTYRPLDVRTTYARPLVP